MTPRHFNSTKTTSKWHPVTFTQLKNRVNATNITFTRLKNWEWLDPSRTYVASLNRSSCNKNKNTLPREKPLAMLTPQHRRINRAADCVPTLPPSYQICLDQTNIWGIWLSRESKNSPTDRNDDFWPFDNLRAWAVWPKASQSYFKADIKPLSFKIIIAKSCHWPRLDLFLIKCQHDGLKTKLSKLKVLIISKSWIQQQLTYWVTLKLICNHESEGTSKNSKKSIKG